MSKMTIIEGNSNDKDNIRTYMVKGEPGDSPTASVTKEGDTATITITDYTGTTTTTVKDGADGQDGADGTSPTATVTKSGSTATITITDKNGTTTATVDDGQTYEVPTGSVVGFEGATVPGGYEQVNSDGTYELSNLPAHTAGTNVYELKKNGKIVCLNVKNIFLNSISTNTWVAMGNIPSEIAPTEEVAVCPIFWNGDTGALINSGRAVIRPDGTWSAKCISGLNSYLAFGFSATWILD